MSSFFRSITFVFLCTIVTPVYSQYDFVIVTGKILDKGNSLEIKDVTIKIPELGKTFKSNEKGQFRFAMREGYYNFLFEKEGYFSTRIPIKVYNDTSFVVGMESIVKQTILKQVVVVANRKVEVEKIEPGLSRISQIDVQNLATLGGEKDIVKSLQTLPGVYQSYEGSANIVVRGGSPDQNLYLLDNVKVYNTNHAMGLLSSYNPSLVKSIEFYRGGFPASYGGFISSVLDVKTKDYIAPRLDANIELGIISGSANFSSPLPFNGSIILSARRTFIDLLSRFGSRYNIVPYAFSDYGGKLMFKRENQLLELEYFLSSDRLKDKLKGSGPTAVTSLSRLNWGTSMFNLAHSIKVGRRTDNQVQIFYTGYKLSSEEEYSGSTKTSNFSGSVNSDISSVGITDRVKIKLSDSISLVFGGNYSYTSFDPAYLKGADVDSAFLYRYIPKTGIHEAGVFIDSEIKAPWKITLRPGIRYDYYKTPDKTYYNLQFRLSAQYEIKKNQYIKGSFSQSVQPTLLLTNTGLGVPFDIWLPLRGNIQPQKADQYTLGYYASFTKITLTVEGFLKTMQNVISYKDGHGSYDIIKSYLQKDQIWEQSIEQGNAMSKGVEFFLEKTSGKFTGWLSYTLSTSVNKFPELNNGVKFWSPFDRRHAINVNGLFPLGRKWKLNVNWQFLSGQPITLPKSLYLVENAGLIDNHNFQWDEPTLVYMYGSRNNDRMKAIHHLDIGLRRPLNFKFFRGVIELGAYNVYNRKNPYYYYGKIISLSDGSKSGAIKSVSLFPIIPYLNIKWFPFRERTGK